MSDELTKEQILEVMGNAVMTLWRDGRQADSEMLRQAVEALRALEPSPEREGQFYKALHRLCHLKQIKKEIEADSSDTVKTMSLQMFYDRNKEEAWTQAFQALKEPPAPSTSEPKEK